MISSGDKIILDPCLHGAGVRRFLEHFHVREGAPDLAGLGRILERFACLPYENLSKIVKLARDFTSPHRIRLPEEVMEDHIQYRLGGTCFSLTFFLQTILQHCGYPCYPVMAHMRNRPNTHCALIAQLGRAGYLVDPGYLLSQPMHIDPDRPRVYRSPSSGVELRFDPGDESFHLYTFNRLEVKWRYRFHDRPVPADEFLGYWHDSFYQSGMHGLCLTRIEEGGLVYLHNDYLRISTPEGVAKRRLRGDVETTVRELFGISPEWVEKAKALIPENMERERHFGLIRSPMRRSAG